MRCNLDVQDLRRTLPPHMWMPSEELDREPTEDELKYPYMHGNYPQRVKDFSLGRQETWGWMQHLVKWPIMEAPFFTLFYFLTGFLANFIFR